MDSRVINDNDSRLINVFDMITSRLQKLEANQDILIDYFIYKERKKTKIWGKLFGWSFDVEYIGNLEQKPRSNSIIIDLPCILDQVKDFNKNIRDGKYDYIFDNHKIDSLEISKIKYLAIQDFDNEYEDESRYYKHNNCDLIHIVSMHLFNDYLKKYDINIKSYDLQSESLFITSKKDIHIDEYINPIISASQLINGTFDYKTVTVYKTKNDLLVAYLILANLAKEAEKLWNKYDTLKKCSIKNDLINHAYFKNYKIDFNEYTFECILNKY